MCEIVIFKGDKECLCVAPEDIETMCRSCLNKEGTINVYETDYRGALFNEILSNFVSCDESNRYPENICYTCANLLVDFYDFKLQIEESYGILRVVLDGISTPSDSGEKPQENTRDSDNELRDSRTKPQENTHDSDNEELGASNDDLDTKTFENREYPYIETESLDISDLGDEVPASEDEEVRVSEENGTDSASEVPVSEEIGIDGYNSASEVPVSGGKEIDGFDSANETVVDDLTLNSDRNDDCEVRHDERPREVQISPKSGKKMVLNKLKHDTDNIRKKYGNKVIRTSRKKSKKRYQCSNCGLTFFTNLEFMGHKRVNCIKKAMNLCTICQKLVPLKEYTPHIRSHLEKSKPYVCETCGYQFSTSGNLKKHKRRHEEPPELPKDRPRPRMFVSHICGKLFFTEKTLEHHVKMHEMRDSPTFYDCTQPKWRKISFQPEKLP